MTDLIDLNYYKARAKSEDNSKSQSSFSLQYHRKEDCIHEVITKFIDRIDQINIKTFQNYVFQIDRSKFPLQDTFYNHSIKIIAMISLGSGIFSLRIQFFDQKGFKVSAKSTHHRTVISNFVFEINAQLQNFKLQYNPVTGQFSFVFNIKAQFMDKVLASELIEFALNSYFEECQAHFYVLQLIELFDQDQNQYLRNIKEDFTFLKRWFLERQQQNMSFIRNLSFYHKFEELQKQGQEIKKQFSNRTRIFWQIKMIKKYLYPETNRFEMVQMQQLCAQRVRQVFKRFKKYFKEEQIIPMYLINKIKYKNILVVNPKQTKNLLEFISGKSILKDNSLDDKKLHNMMQKSLQTNDFQNLQNKQSNKENRQMDYQSRSEQSQTGEEKLRIGDKVTGKHYLVKFLHLKTSAKKQNFILQKLCKFQSYLFINQYIELQNYTMLQNDFIMVNAHPTRTLLLDFLKKNNRIISFSSRIHICINLVQIVYTLHLRNKIQNYFPYISVGNLQISKKLSLSFRILSTISVNPLYELINTISTIIFQIPLSIFKRDNSINTQLIKGDESLNKNSGLSVCIHFLKYYMYNLMKQGITMTRLNEMRFNKKTSSFQNQDIDLWKKEKLTRTCQQLLVIFGHYKNILSRGFQQKYAFEDQSDSQD